MISLWILSWKFLVLEQRCYSAPQDQEKQLLSMCYLALLNQFMDLLRLVTQHFLTPKIKLIYQWKSVALDMYFKMGVFFLICR